MGGCELTTRRQHAMTDICSIKLIIMLEVCLRLPEVGHVPLVRQHARKDVKFPTEISRMGIGEGEPVGFDDPALEQNSSRNAERRSGRVAELTGPWCRRVSPRPLQNAA